MNNQLEFPLVAPVHVIARNFLILGESRALSYFLSIPPNIAEEAVEARKQAETDFSTIPTNFVDSERIFAFCREVDQFERKLIAALVYQSCKNA